MVLPRTMRAILAQARTLRRTNGDTMAIGKKAAARGKITTESLAEAIEGKGTDTGPDECGIREEGRRRRKREDGRSRARRQEHVSFRIVGGAYTDIERWPWAVVIGQPQRDGTFQNFCGGTLIGWDTVLTAAHCFNDANEAYVRVGDTNLTSSRDGQGEDIRVSDIIKHPEWDSSTFMNDVCILKLENAATYASNVRLACLPSDTDLEAMVGSTLPWIVGWGATKSGSDVSKRIKEAQVPLVDQSTCQRKYSGDASIGDGQLCAGDGVRDTCQGDSGGPMLATDNSGAWTVIGITSFGAGCASKQPGVYTRVDAYLDWIQDNN